MRHHKFKLTFFFFLLVLSQAIYSQGSWKRLEVPTNKNLQSICFVDSLYGWIAGDSGTIIHTTDGGANWTTQDTQTTNDIQFVFFLNRNLGWVSEFNFTTTPYGTVLLRTTNGGATWQRQPYPVENLFMTCILFTDSLHGWMGGKPNAIVKTIDGGATWSPATIDTTTLAFFPVLDIKFYNEKYGYASGGILDVAGVIWKTTNGGENWQAIDPSFAPADEVHRLHIFDSLNVMGAGGDPDFGYGVGMIRTSDGGLSWNYNELPIQGTAYDLDFRNETEAWAPLGTKRKLIYSMDAGATWKPVPTPDSTSIYDMVFPDSLHGFAAGREGAFLKYYPHVVPSVTSVIAPHAGFHVYQNYPNPFQTATTIKFEIPDLKQAGFNACSGPLVKAQIAVFDVLGAEVATLSCTEVSPGIHEVGFDAGGLPDGIYWYLLKGKFSGNFVPAAGPKRMVLLHNKN